MNKTLVATLTFLLIYKFSFGQYVKYDPNYSIEVQDTLVVNIKKISSPFFLPYAVHGAGHKVLLITKKEDLLLYSCSRFFVNENHVSIYQFFCVDFNVHYGCSEEAMDMDWNTAITQPDKYFLPYMIIANTEETKRKQQQGLLEDFSNNFCIDSILSNPLKYIQLISEDESFEFYKKIEAIEPSCVSCNISGLKDVRKCDSITNIYFKYPWSKFLTVYKDEKGNPENITWDMWGNSSLYWKDTLLNFHWRYDYFFNQNKLKITPLKQVRYIKYPKSIKLLPKDVTAKKAAAYLYDLSLILYPQQYHCSDTIIINPFIYQLYIKTKYHQIMMQNASLIKNELKSDIWRKELETYFKTYINNNNSLKKRICGINYTIDMLYDLIEINEKEYLYNFYKLRAYMAKAISTFQKPKKLTKRKANLLKELLLLNGCSY